MPNSVETAMNGPEYVVITTQPGSRTVEEILHDFRQAQTSTQSSPRGECYRAKDDQDPQLAIVYDLTQFPKLDEEHIAKFQNEHSLREQALLNNLKSYERKVYSLISVRGGDGFDGPAPVIQIVTLGVLAADVKELNGWYEGEHLEMMSRVPGWIRTRRFKFTGDTLDADQVEFLAVYDFQAHHGLGGPEHKAASATPGTAKIRTILRHKEGKVFQHQATLA